MQGMLVGVTAKDRDVRVRDIENEFAAAVASWDKSQLVCSIPFKNYGDQLNGGALLWGHCSEAP
jgi:hypothetical protein